MEPSQTGTTLVMLAPEFKIIPDVNPVA